MSKESLKSFSLLLLISTFVGLLIGIYQLAIHQIATFSSFLYQSRNSLNVTIFVILIVFLALLNFYVLKIAPDVEGSGIPSFEITLRKSGKINWKTGIFGMIINSFISTFSGLPLGSEGPSVILSAKISEMLEEITKINSKENIYIACGAGFGCAFLSPLSGFCYVFEEELHKINLKLIIKSALLITLSVLISYTINQHFIVYVPSINLIDIKEYYIFPFIIIFDLAIAYLFSHLLLAIKKIAIHHKSNFLIKYSGFAMIFVVFIINFFCINYMGSGGSLISNLANIVNIGVLFGILILRLVFTPLSGGLKVTGGLVVPIITLGALVGQLSNLFFNNAFGYNESFFNLTIIISGFLLFAIIIKAPLTGSALVYSTLSKIMGNYILPLKIIPIVIISMYLGSFIYHKFLRFDSLYDELIKISEKK